MEFISFKKVVIFGAKGSGKSTLSKSFETGSFSEQSPTQNSIQNNIFLNFIIDINNLQLNINIPNKGDLNINLYEVRIDENFVNNKELITPVLFDCQCALFLVDISNAESFDLIKKLISNIDNKKYPYLKKILIENKLDLENEKQVSGFDIKEYLDNNPLIKSEKISLKDGDNLQDILKEIYSAVNESNNDLAINKVLISQSKLKRLEDCEGSIALILIGDSQVGKTNFLSRYINNKFSEGYTSTAGIEREVKAVKLGNKIYKLTIWDTVGQERFKCLPIKYYKNVDGVLLLYDVCEEITFDHVNSWLDDVKKNSNKINEKGEIDTSLFLIANKIDKEGRVISTEKGEQLANSLGMKYFEISCKNDINVHETMARMILDCFKRISPDNNQNIKLGKGGNQQRRGGCCDRKKKQKYYVNFALIYYNTLEIMHIIRKEII